MKRFWLSIVFFVIAVLPSWAIPLPPEVTGSFTGSFVSADYGVNTSVSGTVLFTLLIDRPIAGYTDYLRYAAWRVEGNTGDDALKFSAIMSNDYWFNMPPPLPNWDSWDWRRWDTDLIVEETITGSPYRFNQNMQWYSTGAMADLFGDPWDLITNANFLPAFGEFDLYDRNAGAELTLNFQFDDGTVLAPVPEPATILLLGSGLAGLAAWKRKRS